MQMIMGVLSKAGSSQVGSIVLHELSQEDALARWVDIDNRIDEAMTARNGRYVALQIIYMYVDIEPSVI